MKENNIFIPYSNENKINIDESREFIVLRQSRFRNALVPDVLKYDVKYGFGIYNIVKFYVPEENEVLIDWKMANIDHTGSFNNKCLLKNTKDGEYLVSARKIDIGSSALAVCHIHNGEPYYNSFDGKNLYIVGLSSLDNIIDREVLKNE